MNQPTLAKSIYFNPSADKERTARRQRVAAALRSYEAALRGTPPIDLVDLILAIHEHRPDLQLADARQLALRALADVLVHRPQNHSTAEAQIYRLFPTSSR